MSEEMLAAIKEKINYRIHNNREINASIEVEARLGVHSEKGFLSYVPRAKWLLAKDALDALSLKIDRMKITNNRYGSSNYRQRSISINDEPSKSVLEIKTSSLPLDDIDNWVRYSFSIEIPQWKLPVEIIVEPTLSNINRTRYYFDRYKCYVDLSQIVVPGYLNHSIEIEMMNANDERENVVAFMTCVRRVTMMMNGTKIYYNRKLFQVLSYTVNTYIPIGDQKSSVDTLRLTERIDRRILSQAKPLNMYDLMKGKIINGTFIYDIDHKVDGVRYFLIFSHFGIWLVSPPYNNNLLSTDIAGIVLKNELTVLDVEVIFEEGKLPRIWVIDCFIADGLNIMKQTIRAERLRVAKTVVDTFLTRRTTKTLINSNNTRIDDATFDERNKDVSVFPSIFEIMWKKVTSFKTVEEFQYLVRKLLDEQPFLNYPTDGFILTPTNSPYDYQVFFSKNPADMKKPAILKWKPAEQVTIDFRVVKDESTGKIAFFVDNRDSITLDDISTAAQEIQFLGSNERPFDSDTMIETFSDEVLGGIVEFGWNYETQKFRFVTVRGGKPSPNSANVALDNWKLIIDPLSSDVLMGEGLGQLRFYHNRIKEQLLLYSSKILLDLGAGKGGDVSKWVNNGYKLVFAVEPDPEYIVELRRRALAMGFIEIVPGDSIDINQSLIVIIQAVAQETEKIISIIQAVLNPSNDPKISSRVDGVSIMDVGTFFWENSRVLASVVSTIDNALKPGGAVMWKMMDGDAVRKRIAERKQELSWKSYFSNLAEGENVTYGDFSVTSTGDSNQVRVSFLKSETIKEGGQIEYLTRISDFYQELGVKYTVLFQDRADSPKEVILTHNSLLASSLYLFGVLIKQDDNSEKGKTSPLIDYEEAEVFEDIVPAPQTEQPSLIVPLPPSSRNQQVPQGAPTALRKQQPAVRSITQSKPNASRSSGNFHNIKYGTSAK